MTDDLSRRRLLASIAGAATAGAAGCSFAPAESETEPSATPADEARESVETAVQQLQQEGDQSYVDAYRSTVDSVVQLRVYGAASGISTGPGTGTGFVYDDEHVVTNQHVVESADEVYARFTDGEWREVSVVGTDVYSDLAVLSAPGRPDAATPLSLLEEDPPVGTEVVAIGNPFGFSSSVSAGIVSGVNRTLPAPNNFSIPDAIQTDAPVNPGNSGGPLVALDGRVVGVISAGGGDNIGFAISSPLARRVVPALVESGEYQHAYMGIRLADVGPLIAQENDLDGGSGVYVDEVVEDSPADGVFQGSTDEVQRNGQRVPVGGDVITQMGGQEIPTQEALSSYLALETSPDDTIDVTIVRDGEQQTVELTLGARPDPR